MRTGEVDIGAISSKFLTQALSDITGSTAYPVGQAQMQVLFFGGNYWAQHWPEENEDVFPEKVLRQTQNIPGSAIREMRRAWRAARRYAKPWQLPSTGT